MGWKVLPLWMGDTNGRGDGDAGSGDAGSRDGGGGRDKSVTFGFRMEIGRRQELLEDDIDGMDRKTRRPSFLWPWLKMSSGSFAKLRVKDAARRSFPIACKDVEMAQNDLVDWSHQQGNSGGRRSGMLQPIEVRAEGSPVTSILVRDSMERIYHPALTVNQGYRQSRQIVSNHENHTVEAFR